MRRNLSVKQLKKKFAAGGTMPRQEHFLQEVNRISKDAFYEAEASQLLTSMEFLYVQGQWIRKRWWVLQGLLLTVLWMLLKLTNSSYAIQRYMGILAPVFAMLILPELWKNRTHQAMEIEGASYYSLRQIYAARMFLFVIVDFVLLGVFACAGIRTGKILAWEMLVQFFLPYIVTCCICFRTLYSKRIHSEVFALFLCIVWCLCWTLLVLDDKVYDVVSLPAWMGMTAVSAVYLGYCIARGQADCQEEPLLFTTGLCTLSKIRKNG